MAGEDDRARYTQIAGELMDLAERTEDPKVAEGYLELARVWLRMAADLPLKRPEPQPDRSGARQDA